jgi:hypothetical protein
MMTGGRGGKAWGKTSRKLAIRIAAERLGFIDLEDGYTTEAMQRGLDQEPVAIEAYEMETFTEVHGQQEFQQHPDFEYVGCTPDGLIGEDGLLEVKNPNTETHLFHYINGSQLGKYQDQVQGSLWVTGRSWCEFVSFDSRIHSEDHRLIITRVKRDEEYIKEMEERYLAFEEKVQEYIKQLTQNE